TQGTPNSYPTSLLWCRSHRQCRCKGSWKKTIATILSSKNLHALLVAAFPPSREISKRSIIPHLASGLPKKDLTTPCICLHISIARFRRPPSKAVLRTSLTSADALNKNSVCPLLL